ncbi:MAG: hypothetical protein CSA62_13105 [Planctomycetota bacterium]|nr:MAG: hypothetical protein CSA62_13105 [Planctomycetota bacterium]
MAILQLASLFSLFAALLACTRSKKLSIVFSGLLALLLAMQCLAVLLLGEVADYRFYFHLQYPGDALSVVGSFVFEGVLSASALLIGWAALHLAGRMLRRLRKRVYVLPILSLVSVGFMLQGGGILSQLWITWRIQTAETVTIAAALARLGIDPDDYVLPDSIEAQPGKNLIVLSLESFERGYLLPPLEHLTPQLRAIRAKGRYCDLESCPGGGFTVASLYLAMTGVPAFFGRGPLTNFKETKDCRLTTVPDILRRAGYTVDYLSGLAEFAGTGDLATALGFDVHKGRGARAGNAQSWGLHDKDLFEQLRGLVDERARSGKPFCIVASTISTHFPDGVYDERMRGRLPEQANHLEFMASAVDHWIGQLLRQLDSMGLGKDTALVIFPDHQFMGSRNATIQKMRERGLFVLSNAADMERATSPRRRLSQLDLPSLILASAGVKHNARFLVDLIPQEDPVQFVRDHVTEISSLNKAAVTRLSCEGGIVIRRDRHRGLLLQNPSGATLLKLEEPSEDRFQHIVFDRLMCVRSARLEQDPKLFGAGEGEGPQLAESLRFAELKISRVNGVLHAVFRRGAGLLIEGKGELIRFSREELSVDETQQPELPDHSIPSRARFPCDTALPKPCPMLVGTSGGRPKLGNREFRLTLDQAPKPAAYKPVPFLILGFGAGYREGLAIGMPCKERILLYPRLENLLVLTPVPANEQKKGPCGLHVSVPFPLPEDPRLRGLRLTVQWAVLNLRQSSPSGWVMSASKECRIKIEG